MSGYHCWNVDNLYRWPKAPQSCYLRWAQENMCTKLSVSRWRAKEPRAAPFMQHWHFHLSSFRSMRTHFSESNSSYYVLILAINQTAFFKTNYIKHIKIPLLKRWQLVQVTQSCYLRWALENMCTEPSVSRWRAKEPSWAVPFMQHHFHLSSFSTFHSSGDFPVFVNRRWLR